MKQEFVQAIEDRCRDIMAEMHTALPGKIKSFNPVTGMASVVPYGSFETPDGEKIVYPEIDGVPMVIPQCSSQDVCIAFPVRKGDDCLLIISEDELDSWLDNADADGGIRYDLTNAIAIPGLSRKGNAVLKEACQKKEIILSAKDVKVVVSGTDVKATAGSTAFFVTKSGVEIAGNLSVTGSINVGENVSAGGTISGKG